MRIIGICEGADEQELIVIMALARGGSLRQQLDAAADSGAPLDVQRAIKQMHDAAVGMAFLHSKSVLHRDVKSANLLLDENGRVLVSDFGISKQSSNATTTMGAAGGGSVKGSAPWMAPEAHEGEPTTAAGDVFGFAVGMWEIMSRQMPWEGKQLSQIVRFVCDKPAPQNRPPLAAISASYPAPLLALMQECWAQDPAARPSPTAVGPAQDQNSEAIARAVRPNAGPVRLDEQPLHRSATRSLDAGEARDAPDSERLHRADLPGHSWHGPRRSLPRTAGCEDSRYARADRSLAATGPAGLTA